MPKYRNSLNADPDSNDPFISRRSFLALVGTGVCLLGLGAVVNTSLLGFLFPNAMKEPPSIFSIGRPEEVLARDGKVFNSKQKVFIETEAGKVRVQTAVCTHLGCTVNAVETGYACPCHGSTYDRHGINTGGPAPAPLVYFHVLRAPRARSWWINQEQHWIGMLLGLPDKKLKLWNSYWLFFQERREKHFYNIC